MMLPKLCNSDWDLNPAKTKIGTSIHGLLTEITYLVLRTNEAQILDVSFYEEFCERKNGR